jgi:hypothetical protein
VVLHGARGAAGPRLQRARGCAGPVGALGEQGPASQPAAPAVSSDTAWQRPANPRPTPTPSNSPPPPKDTFSFAVVMFEVFSRRLLLSDQAAAAPGPGGAREVARAWARRVARGHRPELPAAWPGELRELIADCWAQVRDASGLAVIPGLSPGPRPVARRPVLRGPLGLRPPRCSAGPPLTARRAPAAPPGRAPGPCRTRPSGRRCQRLRTACGRCATPGRCAVAPSRAAARWPPLPPRPRARRASRPRWLRRPRQPPRARRPRPCPRPHPRPPPAPRPLPRRRGPDACRRTPTCRPECPPSPPTPSNAQKPNPCHPRRGGAARRHRGAPYPAHTGARGGRAQRARAAAAAATAAARPRLCTIQALNPPPPPASWPQPRPACMQAQAPAPTPSRIGTRAAGPCTIAPTPRQVPGARGPA